MGYFEEFFDGLVDVRVAVANVTQDYQVIVSVGEMGFLEEGFEEGVIAVNVSYGVGFHLSLV